jgi:hypothetical protein
MIQNRLFILVFIFGYSSIADKKGELGYSWNLFIVFLSIKKEDMTMKKLTLILLILSITFFTLANTPVNAFETRPFFLLGQNEKAEVVLPSGKVIPLELGKNPIQVLTTNYGRKLILCGGHEEKSGQIKQGASLQLMSEDLQSYEKKVIKVLSGPLTHLD